MQADPTVLPLPSDVDYIAYHASQQPDKTAIVFNGAEVTYRAFYADIGRFAAALRCLDLAPGQTVGVCHPHLYLHWLAVLALEAIGVISFSYGAKDVAVLMDDLQKADLLLGTPDGLPDGSGRTLLMDQQWIDRVLQEEPEHPVRVAPLAPDTPLRLTRSSGTTGRLKRMHHTAGVRESRIRQFLFRAGITKRSRYLIGMGFNIQGMLYYAMACLRMGGTCIYDGREDLASVLAEQRISHVVLPTYALQQLLDGLPTDYPKPSDLTAYLMSAAVPSELRDKIRHRLAETIIESYGTSEAGGICDMDGSGIGRIMPGVDVEILDDTDRPVVGQVGRVRVRSDGLVDGYVDDPETTATMFRDDWFYPGDLAILQDAHTLKLVGRADDMFNIGGVKFLPGPAEERLREILPVADICLVALPGEAGLDRLSVVAVAEAHADTAFLKSTLAQHLPSDLGSIELIFADRIPRTESGKIKRAELTKTLKQRGTENA